ncbi:MAG TPA: RHS repeat-associated core domain-containing protein [Rhizomicrobium sp.]|nr:RHS repeat-associated core domain-containing protein [Rhizomicrobium sp.]
MASLITEGVNSLAFTYDSEHKRIAQLATGASSSVTTLYVNDPASGAMAEQLSGSGPATWTDYIMADGHMVAKRTSSTTSVSLNYFTLDHLGSISVITDETGAVIQRLSYDAWGKRRATDGTPDPNCSITSSTTRGFTGQEMMPSVCLINFNARIYDPSLGRFMSADPVTQDVLNLQLLNRYSYVANNPLSLTDPTGLCVFGCFWNTPIFRDILAIVIAWVLPEALGALEVDAGLVTDLNAATWGTINVGIAGGVGGFVTTGNLNGAFFSALEANMFVGAGDFLESSPTYFFGSPTATTFIVHGMVGGLFSADSKGGFASGFLAAGVGSLADIPSPQSSNIGFNITEHAILGGAGAALGGGKFANGAITGAFGYMYNYCEHHPCSSGTAEAENRYRSMANVSEATLERIHSEAENQVERENAVQDLLTTGITSFFEGDLFEVPRFVVDTLKFFDRMELANDAIKSMSHREYDPDVDAHYRDLLDRKSTEYEHYLLLQNHLLVPEGSGVYVIDTERAMGGP